MGMDGFGSDEREEMWVLELVTLVSVPQQQRRRLFLFYGRRNERAVLYGRQSGVDDSEAGGRPGPSWTCMAPPGQDSCHNALAAALATCLAHHAATARLQRCYCTTPLFSSFWQVSCYCTTLLPSNVMFTTLRWNQLWQTQESVSDWHGLTPCSTVIAVVHLTV